jgi:lipoprotein-anchoring transpeptidase ErfK/SrfK
LGVGGGLPGSQTKPGEYLVGDKRRDPMWFPPGKEPVPYGDPRNPLGSRWIELELPDGRASHLGFHGTNEPESVGKDASQGCLRMRREDIELLYEILPKGVAVTIQA